MTMRRETIKALEIRRNSVMAERRKSNMQTLGANNEYGVTGMVTNKSDKLDTISEESSANAT